MPILLRVRYVCADSVALSTVRECLSAFAANQLSAPHPGTAVYHFARPDEKQRPMEMEFIEVYVDDRVFWKHLDAGTDIQAKVFKIYDEALRVDRDWTAYIVDSDGRDKLKSVLETMGAECKDVLAGFIFNKKMNKDAASKTKSNAVLSACFTVKDMEKAETVLSKAAEKAEELLAINFTAGKLSDNKIELFASASPEALTTISETLTPLKDLCSDSHAVVYGSGPEALKAAEAFKAVAAQSLLAAPDLGYAAHPQLETLF